MLRYALHAPLRSKLVALAAIIILFVCGCNKPEKQPDGNNAVTDEETNKWITDSLRRYYYWAESLPANVNANQSPLSFFNAVKNSADRFSYLAMPGGASSIAPTNRAKYGFDYVIITEPTTNSVVGLITLVMNASPAKAVGLMRGQYFSRVNETVITAQNAATLQNQILSGSTAKLTMATLTPTGVKEGGNVTVTGGITIEQTALQKTFNINGKKTGYLFFTAFNANERTNYLQVFSSFKAEGITDMILDMRYNAGGDVSAAATMAALIANASAAATFIEYRGNKNGGIRKATFDDEATSMAGPSFTQIQQQALGLTRLYVLTTAATASAAELMINNLKPYLTVIQVGETTRGKDEAAIVITDKRAAKRINWELSPIVYKLFNAQGLGGYNNGIVPTYTFAESSNLPIKAFGDATDPLTAFTLDLITTATKTSALSNRAAGINTHSQPNLLFNSALLINTPLVALQ